MNKEFEVSFNSPQCGWMSIGFEHPGSEFHTTTSHAPYTNALSDILNTISDLISANENYEKTLKWSRDPEEYDFVFTSNGESASIEIIEYPTSARENSERVYFYKGDAIRIAEAFRVTFQQMFDEKDIDEFEENWHQKFPFAEFTALNQKLGFQSIEPVR